MRGEDPLLVLLRAAGGKEDAAHSLSTFLDRESLAPLRSRLVADGMDPADADARARAIDIFLLGVTTRMRMLRDDLGESAELRQWIATTIQRLVDAT